MGADFYELGSDRGSEKIPIGIGRNCVIDRAIIDKNARIADGVVVTPEGKPENFDAENYYIRDGIVVIPKTQPSRQGSGSDSALLRCLYHCHQRARCPLAPQPRRSESVRWRTRWLCHNSTRRLSGSDLA